MELRIYSYQNGDIYEGEWKGNKRDGVGVYKYKNGNIYMGEWKNNQRHGYGILYNDNEYAGQWKNNAQYGYGIYKIKDKTQRLEYKPSNTEIREGDI